MDDEEERVSKLTDLEKEVLREFLRHSQIKDVARSLGKSPFAVEQRLKRARQRTGVSRSIDAALMLARVEGRATYGLPIYAPSVVAETPPSELNVDQAENGIGVKSLAPFPTKGRPWNTLPAWVRIGSVGGGMLFASASIVLIADLLETVTRIVRQMH